MELYKIVELKNEDVALKNCGGLVKKLTEAAESVSEVVLDMKEVDFINSDILDVLLRLNKTLDKENKKLIFTDLQDSVHEVLEITHYIVLFDIYNTRSDYINENITN